MAEQIQSWGGQKCMCKAHWFLNYQIMVNAMRWPSIPIKCFFFYFWSDQDIWFNRGLHNKDIICMGSSPFCMNKIYECFRTYQNYWIPVSWFMVFTIVSFLLKAWEEIEMCIFIILRGSPGQGVKLSFQESLSNKKDLQKIVPWCHKISGGISLEENAKKRVPWGPNSAPLRGKTIQNCNVLLRSILHQYD